MAREGGDHALRVGLALVDALVKGEPLVVGEEAGGEGVEGAHDGPFGSSGRGVESSVGAHAGEVVVVVLEGWRKCGNLDAAIGSDACVVALEDGIGLGAKDQKEEPEGRCEA